MVEAMCNNDGCDRDQPWTLRKPPSEYKYGVKCPDCGTTRVTDTDGNPIQQAAASTPQPQQPTQNQQQPVPQQQGQQQGGVPAATGGEMAERGMQVGDQATQILSGDKYDQMEGAAGFIFQLAQRGRQTRDQRREQARNTTSDQIQASTQYPECPECGTQLSEIPTGQEEFPCQRCGVLLERAPEKNPPGGQDDYQAPGPGDYQ